MIVVDTSFVYALLDRSDNRHADAVGWYGGVREELATTPLALAEIDHLASARAGKAARRAFMHDVAAGAYSIEWWPSAVLESVELAQRYGDIGVSLTDASLVALAARLGTTAIATFDERHFRAMRPPGRVGAFTLLPADAD